MYSIAAESISQTAIATGPDLPLDCEIHFSKIVGPEFKGLELSIGIRPLGCVFSSNLLDETASAVLARPATLSGSWGTLGSYDNY